MSALGDVQYIRGVVKSTLGDTMIHVGSLLIKIINFI